MKINDLFSSGNSIYRVLAVEDDRIQIIDCIKRNMPHWDSVEFLSGAEQITEEELRTRSNVNLTSYDSLSQQQKQMIHSKYGSISFIVPFVGNDYDRSQAVALCSEKFHLSKNTIKSRLCDYLTFQDLCIFLPHSKGKGKPLTADERNFRWALNKYYEMGVNLVFLKEPHINTEVYRQSVTKALSIEVNTGNDAVDDYFAGNMELINRLLMKLAQQIKLAFEQAEKEVTDLHQRISEGMREGKSKGSQIGLVKGTSLITKKSIECKKIIKTHSKAFGGNLSDNELIRLCGCSRNSLYKYKREIMSE